MPGFTPARFCAQAAAAQAASADVATAYWRSRVERLTAQGCDQQPLAAAIAYAHVGDVDTALRWLERAAEVHTDALVYARVHPGLAPLRHTSRYARVIDRVGGPR